MPTATINGLQHYFEDEGSGDALVMIHGAAGSGRGLAQAHLSDLSKDFRVLIPDLRSMGQSEHVTEIPPSAWVDDMVGLLDHLGIEKAHVYGVSLGARVVLRFAIDHPDRTLSLIEDAAIIAIEAAGSAALNARYDVSGMSPEAQERYRQQHGDDWATVVENYFRIRNKPELQEFYNLRELCAKVSAPTLIMRGDIDDPVHPLAHSVEMRGLIPDSRLAIVPKTGSGVSMGEPEMMRQLIRQFVGDISAVPAR